MNVPLLADELRQKTKIKTKQKQERIKLWKRINIII